MSEVLFLVSPKLCAVGRLDSSTMQDLNIVYVALVFTCAEFVVVPRSGLRPRLQPRFRSFVCA
jgi:hypothetical protein